MSAVATLLPDGRLHLQHGPIDCLCRAWGAPAEARAGYAQAARFFASVLADLCDELPQLRAPLPADGPPHGPLGGPLRGPVARAMHAACLPFASGFITPMAAVAGAVADAVLAAMLNGRDLSRGFVNNGGDIAFHLAPSESLRCGLLADLGGRRAGPLPPALDGTFLLSAQHPARGIATSGRACKGQGGRSFSFGIADAVTVLARTAAQADAAATVIGNEVDLPGHEAIDRRPAAAIDPASDLGDRLITFDVGPLADEAVDAALDAGAAAAQRLLETRLIEGAVLALRGRFRILLPTPLLTDPVPPVPSLSAASRSAPSALARAPADLSPPARSRPAPSPLKPPLTDQSSPNVSRPGRSVTEPPPLSAASRSAPSALAPAPADLAPLTVSRAAAPPIDRAPTVPSLAETPPPTDPASPVSSLPNAARRPDTSPRKVEAAA